MLPLCFSAVLLSTTTNPPPQETPTRPRIGLVLSGGGARGAAHVGVLEVLEDAHVPVDFVVGTSMGAIIGGLYAAGSSPAEIRATIENVEWADLLNDNPPREYLAWRRKQEDLDFLIPLEAGWKDGELVVPRGVIQGIKIEPFFRRLTSRVQGTDFDTLPLPFRAVAMDLGSGERVVLKDGDLSDAMRASMSIAGAFAPVEIGGRELVDGGYVDNLPIQLALDMGADIVIAVDVGTPPEVDAKKLGSLFSITSQVQDVIIQVGRKEARALLRPKDVLIEPKLGTLSFADFSKVVQAANIGHEAATEGRKSLEVLAVSDEEWAEFLATQRAATRPHAVISRVRIENQSSLADAVIASRIETMQMRDFNYDAVAEDLARLAGLEIFDRIDYRTEVTPDGETELVYSVHEKTWGPNYLRFGLALEDDFRGNGQYQLGLGLTTTPFADSGAELRTRLTIGTPLRADTELWIPLDAGMRWFVAPSASFERRGYEIEDTGEVLVQSWDAGARVGRILGEWGSVSVGAQYGTDKNTLDPDDPASEVVDTDIGAVVGVFGWDTLDQSDFPTTGTIGWIEGFAAVDALGSSESFEKLQLKAAKFLPLGTATVGLAMDVGSSFGDELPVSQGFFLGGFRRLSGTPTDSMEGDKLFLLRTTIWKPLESERSLLGVPLYVGGTIELGQVWSQDQNADFDELSLGGSVFLAFDTLLGPGALSFGASDGGGTGVALVFGRIY